MQEKNLDCGALYAGLISTLEHSMGTSALGRFLCRIRNAKTATAPSTSADDEAVQRMLIRLGVLPAAGREEENSQHCDEFMRKVADAAEKRVERIYTVFLIFARGIDSENISPVCGRMPQCRQCGITRHCDYFNSPAGAGKGARIPLATRLRRESAECMSDAEILALVLGGSSTGKKHKKAAVLLIERFGDLRGVAGANYVELAALRDIEPAAALRMAAVNAFHKRVQSQRRIHGTQVKCGQDFHDIYYPVLRDLKQEVFITVLLDQKHHIMRDIQVSVGTLTASLVHPREVFAGAIRESAAAVAFVHNHPSGDPAPSAEDRAITRRLCETAKVIGIRVLDHVIIGEGTYYSFVEEGIM